MSGCMMCEGDGIVIDEDGWLAAMSLCYGRDKDGGKPRWFARVFMMADKEDGNGYAENFPVNYCPTCGREL